MFQIVIDHPHQQSVSDEELAGIILRILLGGYLLSYTDISGAKMVFDPTTSGANRLRLIFTETEIHDFSRRGTWIETGQRVPFRSRPPTLLTAAAFPISDARWAEENALPIGTERYRDLDPDEVELLCKGMEAYGLSIG